ncbi:MAG: ATP-binding protein [Myxococcota bacterium]
MIDSDPVLWRSRPFHVDSWLDLPPSIDENFPFEGFVAREHEVLRLSSMINPARNRGGTTILVTGERGSGKTSLVNFALFHAAVEARFGPYWTTLDYQDDKDIENTKNTYRRHILNGDIWREWAETEWWSSVSTPDDDAPPLSRLVPGWGKKRRRNQELTDEESQKAQESLEKLRTWQKAAITRAISNRSRGVINDQALVLLDVHVPLPEAHLSPRQILTRTLRRLYFRLVNSGLADANPDFVRNARLAYLRSMAKGAKLLEKDRYVSSFRAGLEKGQVGLAARQERELAWELAVELERADETELGDDLQLLLQDLARLRLGGEGVLKRSLRSLAGTFGDIKKFFFGTDMLRIHPVIVFDELDKAVDIPSTQPSLKTTDNMDKLAARLAERLGPTKSDDKAKPPDKSDPTFLARTVASLKTVLTAQGASFIFIAGPEHAQRWSGQESHAENLRSVFSDRFHVPRLPIVQTKKILKSHIQEDIGDEHLDHLTRAMQFISGGIFRSVVRLLREAQLGDEARYRESMAQTGEAGEDRTEQLQRGDRNIILHQLEEVLCRRPKIGTTGMKPEASYNNIKQLARDYDIVRRGANTLLRRLVEQEMPNEATRVAGIEFAAEDAMVGAIKQAYLTLRNISKIYMNRGAGPVPVSKIVPTMINDRQMKLAAKWFSSEENILGGTHIEFIKIIVDGMRDIEDEELTSIADNVQFDTTAEAPFPL